MRLLVDLQCAQSALAGRGVGRYALSLTRALAQQPGHRVEVLLRSGGPAGPLLAARQAVESFLPPAQVHVFDAPRVRTDDRQRQDVAEAVHAAAVCSLAPDVLLLGTAFPAPDEAVLSTASRRRGVPTAAVLYDLMPALDPGGYLVQGSDGDYRRRCADLPRVDLLLAISEHSRRQVSEVFGDAAPPTEVVWGGAYPSGAFPSLERPPGEAPLLPSPYLLTVGGDHPRKNLDRLVRAWSRTSSARRGGRLVIACRLTEGTRRRLLRIARQGGVPDEALDLLGEVSEADLDVLYRQAEGFVFPSLEEGLGLPPLEAMHRGCPTLMARGSSLSELSDDEASYVDGQDEHDLARGMDALLHDPDLRARLRATGSRATSRFTFARSAELAWRALEPLTAHAPQRSAAPVVSRPLGAAGPGDAVLLPPVTDAVVDGDPVVEQVAELETLVVAPTVPAALVAMLWAAPAVVACDEADGRGLVTGGLVDVPVLVSRDQDEQRAWLAQVGRRDLYRLVREQLAAAPHSAEVVEELLAALAAPPRWTIQRPWPVWLLVTDAPDVLVAAERLRDLAHQEGLALAVGTVDAVSLARGCDHVLLATRGEDLRAPSLLAARLHGVAVTVLSDQPAADATNAASWWVTATLPTDDDGWRSVLRSQPRRTTGWPAG